jgi:hypothetical protein
LPIGQFERPQRIVKTPGHHPRRTLDMKAKTAVANQKRRLVGNLDGL